MSNAQQAAQSQGITTIIEALAARGVTAVAEDTGGHTMVARVDVPRTGYVIVLTVEDDAHRAYAAQTFGSVDDWTDGGPAMTTVVGLASDVLLYVATRAA